MAFTKNPQKITLAFSKIIRNKEHEILESLLYAYKEYNCHHCGVRIIGQQFRKLIKNFSALWLSNYWA